MLGDPEIVILDEPFSGLDPINAQVLKNAVRRQVDEGRTVIFSSHQMAQVEEFCDDICIINDGHAVLEGNLKEIKRSYPRNLLYVEAEESGAESPFASIERVLREMPFVVSIVPEGSGCKVTLNDPEMRSLLLRKLDEASVPVSGFFVIEPTLEQIFVERVGQ